MNVENLVALGHSEKVFRPDSILRKYLESVSWHGVNDNGVFLVENDPGETGEEHRSVNRRNVGARTKHGGAGVETTR